MNIQNIKTAILFTLVCFFITTAESVENKSISRKTYALVISGITKESQDKQAKAKAVSGLQKFLLDNNEVTTETLAVFTAENIKNNRINSSTTENIKRIINKFESEISSEDRFIFYYTGQANIVGQQLRLNLPGEDITHEQLAQLLKSIKASSILIVLDCPSAGLALKAISGTGRIIICSCTAEQRYSTRFSEYFIPALTDTETDIDENGKISILEAFITASKNIEDWYRQKQLLITEIPVLEDNGDGRASKEPWRYMLDVKDGLAASEFLF